MEYPMAKRTYARVGTDNNMRDLNKQRIPTLVQALLNANIKNKDAPAFLKKFVQNNSLIVPDNEFLVLVGTTSELQQLVKDLKNAGIDEIRCKPGNELVTWCVRVDANHPDHVLGKSTLTVLVIGKASVFGKRDPDTTWQWFGITKKGVLTSLDKDFDDALEKAKKFTPVNA
jgi:hypothetical protein